MLNVIGWLLLAFSWVLAVDSLGRSLWALVKLGRFGYHVPLLLLAMIGIMCATGLCLISGRKHMRVWLFAILPVVILLLSRHWG